MVSSCYFISHYEYKKYFCESTIFMLQSKSVVQSKNGVIRYKLEGGRNNFAVDEKSGQIRLVGRLDYETKKSWKVEFLFGT